MKAFKDRVAVVTGAASGIGLALAERFAAVGAKVVMADIEAPALGTAAEGLRRRGATVLPLRVDVSLPEDLERLARETYDAFGAAHVLCNNAGVAVLGAVHEHTLADSRDLAANGRFVAILQPSATARRWSQAHEARSGSEAQCS